MKTYLLTSSKWSGEVELRYDESGLLVDFTNRAEMTDEQRRWFLGNMPRSFAALKQLVDTTSAVITLVPDKMVDFDMFWSKYDDKVNSSRIRTLKKWLKMPESERLKAYNYVGIYLANIPHGTRRKFAETYLNAEQWNN